MSRGISIRSALSPRERPVTFGLVALAIFAIFMVLLFQKSAILVALRGGDTIDVVFARQYKLQENRTDVKMAGVPIGVVDGIDGNEDGTVTVTVKVDDGIREKLGSTPSAEILPTTVLGGKYYLKLTPGGANTRFTAESIPVSRTRLPVELDSVLRAFPPSARQGLQGTVAHLDRTVKASGEELRQLLDNTAATMQPAGDVLRAARGTRPGTDLSALVNYTDALARVLTRQEGQLGSTVDGLARTARTFASRSEPLAAAIDALPQTLRATRTGARDLAGSLDTLEATADEIRPVIQELDRLVGKLEPVLADLRPLLNDLRPLVEQARPIVAELVPTSKRGTRVLGDLRGPVLDRINGPIIETITSEWHGSAPKYPHGGGTGAKFYEELGYMFTNANNAVKMFNPRNGHMLHFQPGAGPSSFMNTPFGFDRLLEKLSTMYGRPHQGPEGSEPLSPPAVPAPDELVDTLTEGFAR